MKFAVPFLYISNLETYFQLACIMGGGFFVCYFTIFNIIVKRVSKRLRTGVTKLVNSGQRENNPCSTGSYTRNYLMTSSLISRTIYQNISPQESRETLSKSHLGVLQTEPLLRDVPNKWRFSPCYKR